MSVISLLIRIRYLIRDQTPAVQNTPVLTPSFILHMKNKLLACLTTEAEFVKFSYFIMLGEI